MPQSQRTNEGFSGTQDYDAYRPGYQHEAVAEFLQVLGIKGERQARVVDLAAGTGKFTEILAAQPEEFEIIAVEPQAVMREQLIKKNLKNVKVTDGSANDMESIKSTSVAALVTAQAFHWFSNMDTLKEVHRVLEPRGVFGMIWNVEDYHVLDTWAIHSGWETIMRDEMAKLDNGISTFANEGWKKVFDEQTSGNPLSIHAADPLFGLPIGEKSMDVVEWRSKEDIWNRFKTYNQVVKLKGEQLKDFEAVFWNAINASDTEIDDQGRVAVHSKVLWAWTSKIPTEPL